MTTGTRPLLCRLIGHKLKKDGVSKGHVEVTHPKPGVMRRVPYVWCYRCNDWVQTTIRRRETSYFPLHEPGRHR